MIEKWFCVNLFHHSEATIQLIFAYFFYFEGATTYFRRFPVRVCAVGAAYNRNNLSSRGEMLCFSFIFTSTRW